ncbi:MAG TPA: hypothetical protein VER14_07645 [Phototrophicaceae bacterium]|nr:hypothetical protein [Phototrophicaceae bacterium]
MLNSNKTKKFTLLVVAVFAIALFLGPGASSTGNNVASAHKSKKCDSESYYKDHKDYCKEHDSKNHEGEGNLASQVIEQVQSSIQNAQCVSGGNTQDSCNNISTQNQQNYGNNAIGQQGGGISSWGNLASQVIGQFQSSIQNAKCVSGGNTQDSCNNISTQNQQNYGNNAIGQQGGGSKGGNLASQGIGQFQSSVQNSQVVSGGDIEGSGNNINTQNQINRGNNALAQQ